MSHDDDILDGDVPSPEQPTDAIEQAHARRFAGLLDKALAGTPPPAIGADDRVLLETATAIRAAASEVELSPSARASAIDAAIGAPPRRTTASRSAPPRADRTSSRAPWLVAASSALVAAAAVALWLHGERGRTSMQAPTPAHHLRTADELTGPIAKANAGNADARLDVLFADRLDSYREQRLTPARRSRRSR